MKHIIVPWKELSADGLRGVIEEFVSREGTEYGAEDVPMDDKVAAVIRQLDKGEVVLLFDAETQTTNLCLARDLPTEV